MNKIKIELHVLVFIFVSISLLIIAASIVFYMKIKTDKNLEAFNNQKPLICKNEKLHYVNNKSWKHLTSSFENYFKNDDVIVSVMGCEIVE